MDGKHPVSLLQELMARQNKKLPVYIMTDLSTKLCPNFECRVKVDGIEGVAICSAKQSAKRMAAEDALKQMKFGNALVSPSRSNALNSYSSLEYNAVGELNEYTAKSKIPYPTYYECGINNCNEFIIKCNILDSCTEGIAPTKKAAKQIAAHNMVKLLEDKKLVKTICRSSASRVDVVSDDVIFGKFKELSVKTRETPSVIGLRNIRTVSVKSEEDSENDETDNRDTLQTDQEVTDELEGELNMAFNIDVLNKNPCVLLLKFENGQNTTVVETGESYHETYSKLLRSALKVARALKIVDK